MGILDDDDAPKRSSGVELPIWMWDRLADLAEKRGKSRNWVITKLLTWALNAYDQEQQQTSGRLDGPETEPKKKR